MKILLQSEKEDGRDYQYSQYWAAKQAQEDRKITTIRMRIDILCIINIITMFPKPHCYFIVHAQRFNEGRLDILEPKVRNKL